MRQRLGRSAQIFHHIMAGLRTRLIGQRGWLIALAGLFTLFVAWGGLDPDAALAGYLAALTYVLIRPRPAPGGREKPPQSAPARGWDTAAFVEALGDPCLVLDRRNAVLYRNAAAMRHYPNVQAGKVLTLTLRHPQLLAALDTARQSGEAHSFEMHETVPEESWHRVVVAPLRRPGRAWRQDEDENGHHLVIFQSLTESKRIEAMRSDFIANASHELRTPLASLLGFIDTLLGPAAGDGVAREKFLRIMRGQAERMSRLIDDMLSLSRIETYQHMRPTGSVELVGLLREVREGLQAQAKAAGVAVGLTLPEDPAVVTADRGQLYEVFENLIENAIKYGATGKVVEVGLMPIDQAGFRYRVRVADHGPGVAPEHVPRLTERFYRIEADAKKKGTGLGLAIVKHIVQRHRGHVSITSKPGKGLRVDVLLP